MKSTFEFRLHQVARTETTDEQPTGSGVDPIELL